MVSTPEIAAVVGVAGIALLILRSYNQGGSCHSKAKLHHKTVIITGGNTGIGKATAIDLAQRGARVILACRSESKGKEAVEDIIQQSGNSEVIFCPLDLASLQSVRDFADYVNEKEDRVDILLNNAGIMMCPYSKTQDGFEMQIGTNHFGHFLLTNLLLDKLKTCAPSRIINVSSLAHMMGKINFDDINSEKGYGSVAAYSQSKLANVLFTRELAKRLQGTAVTANSLHPGAVDTELQRHFSVRKFSFLNSLITPLIWLGFKTPKQGAQTSIFCAVDESLERVSGKYFSDCREKTCAKQAYDDDVAKRLWHLSEELTGLSKKRD
ncbi:Retinol dehydrogenase 13 [Trichoplax sp. H2]|nr:Retinol dehydrogenase 13 [Trichoplax sp. H2]|eukprot:RDD40168.1 Retinol dehydrogenase 13 [Trichoplax sp. H2]